MKPSESFLCQPIRSLQTMLRVIAENDPNYIRIVPDGIYGPETVGAVTGFQRNHGLSATGVANQETWDAVYQAYEKSVVELEDAQPLGIQMNPRECYCKGDRSPNIHIAQGMLSAMSETCCSIGTPSHSGVMDDATCDSIASFQQLCNLPANGKLDKTTWKHLALHYPQAVNIGHEVSKKNEA